MRIFGLLISSLAILLAMNNVARLPAQTVIPLKPTLLSVDSSTLNEAANALSKAGLRLETSSLDLNGPSVVKLSQVPLWTAVEAIAKASGSRIELLDQGRRVSLVKSGAKQAISSIQGPFRVVVRQVNGRLDLETGNAFQELELLVHWEPQIPVFRMAAVPTVTSARDNLGNSLRAEKTSTFSPVHGGSSHGLPLRLLNVPRKAGVIAELSGHFTVTASERMLPFTFSSLGGKLPVETRLPQGVNAGGVRAMLTGWQIETINTTNYWEATIRLSYPAGMPVFESFETWLGENKLRLVTPQGVAVAPAQVEEPQPAREMSVVYRFDAAKLGGKPVGAGWSLVYETPSPVVEFQVPFTFQDVPLP